MKQTEKMEILFSRKQLFLGLIGASLFVGIGLWFVISPPKMNDMIFGNPTIFLIIGIMSLLFFGIGSIFIAKKLFDDGVGLVVQEEGVFDASSATSVGLILWSDIEAIKVRKVSGQKLLLFALKNPQGYINKQTNIFKRLIMQINLKLYSSPILISTNLLAVHFDTLHQILQRKIDETK